MVAFNPLYESELDSPNNLLQIYGSETPSYSYDQSYDPGSVTMSDFTPQGPMPTPQEQVSNQVAPNQVNQVYDTPASATSAEPSRANLSTTARGEGFWPNFLAVAAAVSGNFGPAMQLQEQKRKTALASEISPHVAKLNAKINRGDFEGAQEDMTNLAASFGPRSPELVTYLSKLREDTNKIQSQWENASTAAKFWTKIVKDDNDPRKPAVDAFNELVKNKSKFSAEHLIEFAKSMGNSHIQNIDGQNIVTNPATLETRVSPLPTVFDPAQLKGYAGEVAQASLGLTANEITNVMRGKPINRNGQEVTFTPQQTSTIGSYLAKLAGQQAQLTLGQQIPISPEQATQAAGLGYNPMDIAGRRFTGQGAKDIAEAVAQQAERLAVAPIYASFQDPYKMAGAGLTGVNADVSDVDFGNPIPIQSLNEINASGGKIITLPEALHQKVIVPTIQAIKGLNSIPQMFEDLGLSTTSPATPIDRLETGVRRTLENRLGISFKKGDTLAKVHEAIANRAIEQVADTQAFSDATIGQLKKFVTGISANPNHSLEAVRDLQERLRDRLGDWMSHSKVNQAQSLKSREVTGRENWLPLAKQLNVDEKLARAIKGNEGSAPGEKSFMNAIGQWQVTEPTAAPYLKRLGITDKEALADENVNNMVGLMHISELQRKHPGRPDLVMAEYHGGPGAITPDGRVNPESKEPDRPGRPGLYTTEYVAKGLAKMNGTASLLKKFKYSPGSGR
jgi:hypothetical protein